jgi:tetratricopeptide (TPR) repeat protein
MVLPAPTVDDAPRQAWLRRIDRVLSLTERGVLILLSDARPSHIRPLVDQLRRSTGATPLVVRRARELEEAQPGTCVVLVAREADAGWLNAKRPIFSDRELRVIVWAKPGVVAKLRAGAPDFFDWISHVVDAPPPRRPLNLPFRRRMDGPPAQLARLTSALVGGRTTFLVGAPGIGKSTLAIAAIRAREVEARYGDRRLWVLCDTVKDRYGLVDATMRALGILPEMTSPGENVEGALIRAVAASPIAIVWDDLEPPLGARAQVGALIRRLVAAGTCSVLVTTRENWLSGASEIAIEPRRDGETNVERLAAALAGGGLSSDMRRTLSILASLPAGATEASLVALTNHRQSSALHGAVALGWIVRERGRIVVPAAVRELLQRELPMSEADATRVVEYYIDRAIRYAPVRTRGWRRRTRMFEAEATNIGASIQRGIAVGRRLDDVLKAALSYAEAARHLHHADLAPIETAIAAARAHGRRRLALDLELELAWALLWRFELDDAERRFKSLRSRFEQEGDVEVVANVHKALGDIALRRSDYGRAQLCFEDGLEMYARAENIVGAANCVVSLAEVAARRQRHLAAYARYLWAQHLYHRVGLLQGEANCLYGLAKLDVRLDPGSARQRLMQSAELYGRVGDVLGAANTLTTLGRVGIMLGDIDESEHVAQLAQKLYRRIGYVHGEANTVATLAHVAQLRGDDLRATALFLEAADMFGRVGDLGGRAQVNVALGRLALERGDLVDAKLLLESGARLSSLHGDIAGQAEAHRLRSRLAATVGDLVAARRASEEALEFATRAENPRLLANCLVALGVLDVRGGGLEAAEQHFIEAREVARASRIQEIEVDALEQLADVAVRQGRVRVATSYYEAAIAVRRAVSDPAGMATLLEKLAAISAPTEASSLLAKAAQVRATGGPRASSAAGTGEK